MPLIRQSIETRSSAPILWWGDYVDFGDFSTAVSDSREDVDSEAIFSFFVRDLSVHHRDRYPYHRSYYSQRKRIRVEEIEVAFAVSAHSEKTFLKRIELEVPAEGIKFSATFSSKNSSENIITVNGIDVSKLIRGYEIERINPRLFTHPIFVSKSKDTSAPAKRYMHHNMVFSEALERVLQASTPNNLSDETIQREVRRIFTSDNLSDETLNSFERLTNTKAFKRLYAQIREQPTADTSSNIRTLFNMARSFTLLEILEEELTDYFLGVGYIGPARAAGERFYRKQELEVSEISSDGRNFPMFLASLTPTRLSQFSQWVENIFGYGIELGSSGGHISINLRAGSRTVNVTDTGYGVSQILPVLGMIWWASIRRGDRHSNLRGSFSSQTLAIEQPELHLHPAHQAKLADVFAGAIQQSEKEGRRTNVRLVVETHSEALINRLGELIEDGTISHNDVQIVIFSAEDDINSPTKVTLAEFDQEGVLNNWPFGFFNYS